MKFTFDVSRKIVVDGKEYRSLEEMPEEVREAFRKASGKGLSGLAANAAAKSSGFRFTIGGDADGEGLAEEERKLRADAKAMLGAAGAPVPPELEEPGGKGLPAPDAADARAVVPGSPGARRLLVACAWLAALALLAIWLMEKLASR
jgi:hypothetical protein